MSHPALPEIIAKQLRLSGQVQGIGLRPAVTRWATQCCIAGWVANDPNGVLIHAEGSSANIQRFLDGLFAHLPDEARISSHAVSDTKRQDCKQFDVGCTSVSTPVSTPIPLDAVTCEQCMSEALCENNHLRYAYFFNSCAQCGPRYSIIRSMPFEREHTTMTHFPLCSSCHGEFTDPTNRRFHAQTTSCRTCGPRMYWCDPHGNKQSCSHTVIDESATLIRKGAILALKGMGGYQLICDATSDDAVLRLRQRKGRNSKPLAVMVKDLAMAATLAEIGAREPVLTSRVGPIVLCPSRPGNGLSRIVHPGLHEVGIMLPTTAYHRLLCEKVNKPLIVTSGNREGEPLAYSQTSAAEQLSSMGDIILHHDRDIVRPIDDSVVRLVANRVATIRLGRGLAPCTLPVKITKPFAALGGQQKVALALSNGHQAILGPHLGDMDTIASQERFVEQYQHLCELYGTVPHRLIHDNHPDYFTTRWAQQQATEKITVQHHHAHVVAAMLEHGWLNETVLGIAFDGTGYGEDHTIWGGEFLLATTTEVKRLAHLRPFLLLGGEQAIRHPQRVTLALLNQVLDRHDLMKWLNHLSIMKHCQPMLRILDTPQLHAKTTSAGRLFDGIASLLLSLVDSHYEGEPAMLLEACCDQSASGSYPCPFINDELDWRPMLLAILKDIEHDMNPGTIAMRFHRSVAQGIVSIIRNYPQYPVILTGGCFQNKILVELVRELLDDNTRLGLPGMIPCNDGGLAAGQLVVAAARLNCLSL